MCIASQRLRPRRHVAWRGVPFKESLGGEGLKKVKKKKEKCYFIYFY
jgi:hypothetical protein